MSVPLREKVHRIKQRLWRKMRDQLREETDPDVIAKRAEERLERLREEFEGITVDIRPVIEAMVADGFMPGAPPSILPMTLKVDEDACRLMRCRDNCGCGMRHMPFHSGERYRAVALCPVCGFHEAA